jgi:hypothetical protein
MPVIRNSPRAFLIALLPLALLHAALMANGVAGSSASGGPLPLPDRAFLVFALRLGIDAVLLWTGHILLRAYGASSRGAYGCMGGIAAAAGYTLALQAEIWLSSPVPGSVITSAILPVIAGMLAGFFYAQFARRAPMPAVAPPLFAPQPAQSAPPEIRTPPPIPSTFDGPVQVRTSIAATAIAAAIPTLVVTIPAIAVLSVFLATADGPRTGPHALLNAQLAMPAQMFFGTLFAMFVPSAIVVGATHALARAFRRTRGYEYALIGAATGGTGALVLVTLVNGVIFLMVLGAATGALMGAVYRRFAGIEPLALPEDVLADDPAALVPEDHPSRKTRAVIFNTQTMVR